MMEQIEFILDYIGKSFNLLDRVPIVAGVSLGAFCVFLIVLDVIIYLVYNQEEIPSSSRSERKTYDATPKYERDYYKFRGG